MASFGFGRFVPHSNRHWSFPAEFGVVYMGAPGLTVNPTGSVCTTQAETNCSSINDPTNPVAVQFNDNLKTFEKAGVTVLGISPDKAEKHVKFRTKYGLKFALLTDADKSVMEKYGAWGEKTMYGKKTVGTIRSTFLVGANGKIERAWYNVRADGHAAKVLEVVNEA